MCERFEPQAYRQGAKIDADISQTSNTYSFNYKDATANIDTSDLTQIKLFIISKILADPISSKRVKYKVVGGLRQVNEFCKT